jgi:carbon storage regulator
MLVLTRRPNETIVIDGKIRVTILGIKGGQVRIGIEAPPEVVIDREEVAQRKNAPAEKANETQQINAQDRKD